MRKILLGLIAATLAIPAATVPAAAKDRYDRYYDRDGYYSGPTWRDDQGRERCRRSDGTTGLVVGAAAGALVGRAIDRHGERATGTIVGAVAGAIVGREVERSNRNRCR